MKKMITSMREKHSDIGGRILNISILITVFLFAASSLVTIKTYAEKPKRISCDSFRTHEDAQEYFEHDKDVYRRLDANNNGIACEDLLKKIK